MFDMDKEDDEFMRNFNMPIETMIPDQEHQEQAGEDDIDAANYVNIEVGIRKGEELKHGIVKRRIVDEEGKPVGQVSSNSITDTRLYEIEYKDGQREILAANLLAENLLAQVDEHGHKYQMMESIMGHRKSGNTLKEDEAWYTTHNGTRRRKTTTKGWELFVLWKDGSSN